MSFNLGATGHRALRTTRGPIPDEAIRNLILKHIPRFEPDYCISGMALGWDMCFAEAALTLHIPLIAAVPFSDQPVQWPNDQITRYYSILSKAYKIKTLSFTYEPDVFARRNYYIVKLSNHLLVAYDGRNDGGTHNCITYAAHDNLTITNLWPQIKRIK